MNDPNSMDALVNLISYKVMTEVKATLADIEPKVIRHITIEVLKEVDQVYSLRIQRLEEYMAYIERSQGHNNNFNN